MSQSIKTQRIISLLRTGFCRLNEYRYKTGLQDSSNCRCRDLESVQHNIEDYELYDNIRERLRMMLSFTVVESRISVQKHS